LFGFPLARRHSIGDVMIDSIMFHERLLELITIDLQEHICSNKRRPLVSILVRVVFMVFSARLAAS
jgi:hypothetical protein